MAPRVPRLPKAKPTEIFCISAAGVGVLAPLYMAMPGAEERLQRQTNKWAPRWERNINYFSSPAERTAQRIDRPSRASNTLTRPHISHYVFFCFSISLCSSVC
ncbi:hypothetical protein V8C43DRAFT_147633 [Trichoderma afarasin]